MRLGTIFYLYRVRLRARLVQELLAVAGIAVGVALLFASQVANTSLTGSVTRLADDLVGNARLQLVARDPNGFAENRLAQVQALAGVKLAVAVLEREVNVVGPRGSQTVDLIGLNPAFLGLESPLLSHVSPEQISQQHGLALPYPVAERVGARTLLPVTVQVGSRNVKRTLAVVLHGNAIGSGVRSPVAIMPLGEAQMLTGSLDRVNHILVEPVPGRDRTVRAGLERLAAGRLNVRPANFDAVVFQQAEGPTIQSTELFSAISALVGFLFAFNAMLLTVPQRRNLVTDLRLDGYASLEIAQVMMFDVLMLGAAGTLVGLALGDLLSHSLLQSQPGYLSLAFPVGSQRVVSWQSIAIATAGGLMAATLGVIFPLRREIVHQTAPGSAVAAPQPSKLSTSRIGLLVGTICVGLTTFLLATGINNVGQAVLSFFSLTMGLLLVLPFVFAFTIALIERAQRPVMGVSSRIAIIELLSSTTRSRSLAIAATGAIAVFGSVAIEGAQGSLREGLRGAAADLSLGADLWVTPSGGATTLATTPFDDTLGHVIGALAGVSSVGKYRGGFLDVGDRRVVVLAPPRSDPLLVSAKQVVVGNSALALSRLRSDGWLTVSRDLASGLGLEVGDRLLLVSPQPHYFRVAAITTNFGWSPGAIVMNAADYAKAWGSRDVSAYQVLLRPGVSVQRGLAEVRAVLSSSALVVQSASHHEQNEIAGQHQGLARLTAIALLVLVAAALAMAAAIGAMIWQRRPRLAGMKVDGFDEKELWGALLWESALLLAIGCSVGAVFGLYGQLVLSHALVSVTGFPVRYSVALDVAAVSIGVVTAIALVVVAVPGYLAVRIGPALQD
ncbi:MAG TPA: FtsX-like permease family protein [Solirubrobacteraceae bacterium]|jgi:putative ABC transport system permease protein|nr:FtsX-like permease family protein [Solirubrobacteraceae bacterium]